MNNNELSTLNILNLFESTKEQRQSFCNDVISNLNSGYADPLKVHLQVKCIEDLVKQLTGNDEYRSLLLDAAAKYGKEFPYQNAKFSVKEAGVKYDYSKCEDLEYNELSRKLDELTAKIKSRETFLKTLPSEGLVITDQQSGETYPVYPPAKSSTTTVAVTLK